MNCIFTTFSLNLSIDVIHNQIKPDSRRVPLIVKLPLLNNVSEYARKTTLQSWTEHSMEKDIIEVTEGRVGRWYEEMQITTQLAFTNKHVKQSPKRSPSSNYMGLISKLVKGGYQGLLNVRIRKYAFAVRPLLLHMRILMPIEDSLQLWGGPLMRQ